tara:strand:- start:24460 stop:25350 length:891 start_codon:yes stop_codon:yes gene_type:complete
LLSISQTSRGFFCIEWVSTEKGPIIINLEHVKLNLDFKNENDLRDILELYKSKVKSESKSLSIVLNSSHLSLSGMEVLDSNDKNKNIIDWHESNILGSHFCKNHYNYYFPLYSNKLSDYLGVYLPRNIKDNILNCSLALGYELRYLSIDIFSAALGAKQIYNNEIDDEYLIWKICNNNTHKLVLYDGYKLKAYLELYKKNNEYISRLYVGSSIYKELLINCVTEIVVNKSNFHRFKNIYIYQTMQSKLNINKIIDLNFKNIKVLNFNKIIDKTKDYNPLKFLSYVENGIAFKGLDI